MNTTATKEAEAPTPSRRLPAPGRLVRLWPRVRVYRGLLSLASLTLTVSALLGLAFPMVVRYLLDAAFIEHNREVLDRIAIGLVILFSVQAVLNYAQTYLLSAVGERVVAGLRSELFAKLLEMPPGFFAERRTGELTSRLTTDIGLLQGVLSHQIAEFSRQVLALIGGIVLLTLMQPRLTLTALGVVPLVIGTALYFGRRLRRMTVGVQDKVAEATAVAEEAFSQIRTVQSFVQEPAERMRYGERIGASVRAALTRAQLRGIFFGVLTFSTFVGIVFVLWQGGLLVLEGQLTPGELVQFLLYTITIAAAIGALASFFSSYQEAVGAAERVFEILEMPPSITDPEIPAALPSPALGSVTFERVSFRYQRNPSLPWTLEDIDLHVTPGEVVALVGPSGGGKTTLVSLLPRFWEVDRGRVMLDGIDVRNLRLADLRGAIGIVPQDPALFSGTVRENIAYARPGASQADVEAAARAAHAHEFIDRLSDGYDTIVGERGIKLSGGQRQRIAIARAILKNPAVLILDEATSNLDTESERLIEDALGRLLVIDRGRIVEEGSHAELLELGGLYARLYQRQFREDPVALEINAG